MEKQIRQEMDASAEKARSDPIAADDFALDVVYHQPPPNYKVRGCDIFTWKSHS
ncbi:unnamed protein product [Protopolystoma xenopodis]|uniref:Uncharacterized protein n=1 Tax=Protopolystoma xenopodis TaxID=117903 RepID=A0A448WL84_9PLAT|nr:unnamed protein product [Protopolystoma xenopodis]